MVGPFKTARGGLTHLLVVVDKFTKWVEAKPIKKLDGATATKFIVEITTRFGIPHSIITDNVMHLKCIHELCTIILVFHSYLHYIRVISLFYIDFGDNSQFPHLFGINPA